MASIDILNDLRDNLYLYTQEETPEGLRLLRHQDTDKVISLIGNEEALSAFMMINDNIEIILEEFASLQDFEERVQELEAAIYEVIGLDLDGYNGWNASVESRMRSYMNDMIADSVNDAVDEAVSDTEDRMNKELSLLRDQLEQVEEELHDQRLENESLRARNEELEEHVSVAQLVRAPA